jgi:cytochrome P450
VAFWLRPAEFLERCREHYGDAFTMRIANEGTWVVLADPAAMREVFAADPEVARAGEGNAFLRPLLGPRSVITLDGDEHLVHRRMLGRALQVRPHEQAIREVARAEVARWRPGEVVPVLERMQAITLEVIVRVVLGVDDRRAKGRVARLMRLATWPPAIATVALVGYRLAAWHPLLIAMRAPVRRMIDAQIRERRAAADLGERTDALSLLVRDGGVDDRSLRDEVLTLVVAGYDTTATGLAWAIERLAREPADDLDALVRDSLCRRTVVPLVARRLAAPLSVAGLRLPAGTTAVPCPHLAGKAPFGGGTRCCLGAAFASAEMRIVLEEITRRVELEAIGPPARPRRRAHMLAPRGGVRVRVRRHETV